MLFVGGHGVIEWKRLANPNQGIISEANKLFHLVAKILYMVIKHPVKSHPKICSGQ
jgi:hypothetical protein